MALCNIISLVLFVCRAQEPAKGESLYYSEVVPSNKRKKRASTSSTDVKADNVYNEPKGAPTKGYTSLLIAGGQGDTGAPSQEALYDQPVSLIVLCTFKLTYVIDSLIGIDIVSYLRFL